MAKSGLLSFTLGVVLEYPQAWQARAAAMPHHTLSQDR